MSYTPRATVVTQQPTWHIDAAHGDDSNDGLTPATAIRTVMGGYYGRFGLTPSLEIQEDWYIHGDLDPADSLLNAGFFGPNGYRNIHGVPTVLHAGALTGVVAYDQATGQWDEIQETGFDFTPFVKNSLVVIDTGSPNGPSYCYITKAIALGRARVSYLAQRVAGEQAARTIGPAAPGNTYEIQKLPFITNFAQGEIGVAFSPFAVNFNIYLEFLHLPIYTEVKDNFPILAECIFDGCQTSGTTAQIANPCFAGPLAVGGFLSTTLGCIVDSEINVEQGMWLCFGFIMQNSQINTNVLTNNGPVSNVQIHHDATGLGVFDSTNPFIIDEGATMVLEGPIWGKDNTGTTIAISRGAKVCVEGPPNRLLAITPAGGNDFTIDGATSLPAVDPVTFAYTAPIPLSFANYYQDVAGGGFQKAVFNPRFPATGMVGG